MKMGGMNNSTSMTMVPGRTSTHGIIQLFPSLWSTICESSLWKKLTKPLLNSHSGKKYSHTLQVLVKAMKTFFYLYVLAWCVQYAQD